jgi:hypothetical protein
MQARQLIDGGILELPFWELMAISCLWLIRSFQVATSGCGAEFDDAQDIRFWLKQPDKHELPKRTPIPVG